MRRASARRPGLLPALQSRLAERAAHAAPVLSGSRGRPCRAQEKKTTAGGFGTKTPEQTAPGARRRTCPGCGVLGGMQHAAAASMRASQTPTPSPTAPAGKDAAPAAGAKRAPADWGTETVFLEGPPAVGDLITNLALGITLLWLARRLSLPQRCAQQPRAPIPVGVRSCSGAAAKTRRNPQPAAADARRDRALRVGVLQGHRQAGQRQDHVAAQQCATHLAAPHPRSGLPARARPAV